ncbi:hypothetical protein ACFXPI_32105 [Streptomyces sp. NPDC059104]|uniref:hypothetical protein n=1 Tax=Streptomyces sp. NPDC059104 TaxID=3346729 RepID=UPI0036941778
MINRTVRGVAVLAAAGVVWMGAASTSASAATTTTTTTNTTVATAADTSTLRPGRPGEDDDRGHACVFTTAWGTGDCHQRLH